jgi:hypothetical protein
MERATDFPAGFFDNTDRAPDGDVTYGDYGRAVGIGAVGVGKAAVGLLEYLGAQDPDGYNDAVKRWADDQVENLYSGMSARGQRSLSAEFLPNEDAVDIFDDDVSIRQAITLKGLAAIPSFAASIAAAVLGGPVAGGAVAGAITAGSVFEELEGLVARAPEEELMQNPYYEGLRSAGMDEARARVLLQEEIVGIKPLLQGVFTGVTAGAFGAEGLVGGAAAARQVGRARGTLIGAGREAGQEAADEGVQSLLTQTGRMELSGGDFDFREIANRMLEGGTIGAALGGTAGFAFSGRGRENAGQGEQENTAQTQENPAVGPAEQAAIRGEEVVTEDATPAVRSETSAPAPTAEQNIDLSDPDTDIDTAIATRRERRQATNAVVATPPGMPSLEQAAALGDAPAPVAPTLAPVIQPTAPTAQAPLQPPVSAQGIAGTAPTVDTAALAPAPVAEAPALPPEVTPAPVQEVAPAPPPAPVDDFSPISGARPDGRVLRDEVAQQRFEEAQALRDRAAAAEVERSAKAAREATRRATKTDGQKEAAGFVVRRQDLNPRAEEMGDDAQLPITEARLEAMIAAAREDGVNIPKVARKDTPDEVALLVEAQKHLARIKKLGGKRMPPQRRRELDAFLGRHLRSMQGQEAMNEARRERTAEENIRGSDAASSAAIENATAVAPPP